MGEVENRRSLLEEDDGDDESLGLGEKMGRGRGEVEEEAIAAAVAELRRASIFFPFFFFISLYYTGPKRQKIPRFPR